MELPRCEADGCAAKVEVRLVRASTQTPVEERHYCAGHAKEALDEITREFARGRDALAVRADRSAVDVELVICDGRDGHPCQVILREVGGPRRLRFSTGRFEAWTLSWELRREPAPTLSTHRAMVSAFRALGGEVADVTITDVSEGDTYRAQVHISQRGSLVAVDMRSSDALVLAVVCNIPVYVEGLVWQKTAR
ncbi:MAG: bifunctional nuclease domain-containing protein [Thermoguttaceae bacterium]